MIDLQQIPDDGLCITESQSIILEPLKFSAQVIRNISAPSAAFANVDVQLHLDRVKVCKLTNCEQVTAKPVTKL